MMTFFILMMISAPVAMQNTKTDLHQQNTTQTNTTLENTTQKTVVITERINWELSKTGEAPYLAVLYGMHFFNDSFNHRTSGFHPGRACGGVLLTRNRILTLCACVRTFYIVHKLGYLPRKNGNESYDIQAEYIIVKFPTDAMLSPKDETYSLGMDPTEFMTDTVCTNDIEYGQGQEFFQASMIVMPLTPEIGNWNWEQLPLWPPYKIHGYYGLEGDAELVAFGVSPKNSSWEFVNDSGGKLNFSVRAVDIFLIRQSNWTDHCHIELNKTSGMRIPLSVLERSMCFRARDRNFQLCGGVIGFPIATPDYHLAGMSSSEIDCTAEGSLVGTVFDDVTVYEIQKFVGVENLHLSTTGNPRTASMPALSRGCEMSIFRLEAPNVLYIFAVWSSLTLSSA